MALPLIALASVIGAGITVTNADKYNKGKYRKLEQLRRISANDESIKVVKLPSDRYCADVFTTPMPGSLVCCEVFNVLDHTGIWIDKDTIIELSNNGLVKAVSAERFLDARSGEYIFVACDAKHQPFVLPGCESRAINSVFTYREYDLVENNCHRFSHFCLSGNNLEVSRFTRLNELLMEMVKQNIYWDKVKL